MDMGKERSQPGCFVVVEPAGPGAETRFVLLAALSIVAVCAVFIFLRQGTGKAKAPEEWTVDAFNDLRPQELSVFNGLNSAVPEILLIHTEIDGWPTVDSLAGEYIPPFVHDSAWRRDGGYQWDRVILSAAGQHIVEYVGTPEEGRDLGSFLLLLLHDHGKSEGNASAEVHKPFEIWFHVSPSVGAPDMVTDQALISKGWQLVVARRAGAETGNNDD